MNKGIEKAHKGMIMVLAATVLLLVAAAGTASATTAASEWDRTFGANGTDAGKSVQQTDDGGYIITGYKAFPNRDLWLIKTDSAGVREWDKTFGNASSDKEDWGNSVQQTGDGGYIIAGKTKSYGAGNYDAWLIKTDSSGIETWNKTFGGSVQDYAESVQQTDDGGYIIAGWTRSYTLPDFNYEGWLIKTDSLGKEEWNKTYDLSDSGDYFMSVRQTSDGYITAGYVLTENDSWQYWLLKTNASGSEQWNRTYGGTARDQCYELALAPGGGYVLAGKTKSYGSGNYDFWLLKTDSSGDELWNRTYGGSGIDSAYSLDSTSDGGYVIAGNTKSYGAGKYDVWMVKTDSNGTEEWGMTFGGTEDDYGYSVRETSDSYIIAGKTKSFGTGDGYYDVWLIHTEGPACIGENYRFTCGDVVNESCTFNADLTCPAATAGLIIGADGITIDGAGYKITGDLTGATCNLCDATNPSTISGIYNAGYDNVVIRNLEVEGFCTGISLKGTGPDKVRNITINNCEIHDNGLDTGSEIGTQGIHACNIDVGDGGEPALTITNNTVYNNEGTGTGCGAGGNGVFIVAGGGAKHEKAVISHNNLYDNAKAGFWTKAGLDQSEITYNEVWGNGNGTGITDNTRGGIILRCKASNKNLIAHNNVHDHVVDGCGYGIYVGGSNNTIEYNNVTNNSKHGISMFRSDGSFDNSLYENRVCDNGMYDLYVWSPTARNHGDNNICDTTHDYDDTGTSGCTYSCGAHPPKGDLDGDDEVTSADAVIALRMAVRGEYLQCADVSGDDQVTSLDALLILQWAAGAI